MQPLRVLVPQHGHALDLLVLLHLEGAGGGGGVVNTQHDNMYSVSRLHWMRDTRTSSPVQQGKRGAAGGTTCDSLLPNTGIELERAAAAALPASTCIAAALPRAPLSGTPLPPNSNTCSCLKPPASGPASLPSLIFSPAYNTPTNWPTVPRSGPPPLLPNPTAQTTPRQPPTCSMSMRPLRTMAGSKK
jgi:hypothetical protein